jgi:hypothetical protein
MINSSRHFKPVKQIIKHLSLNVSKGTGTERAAGLGSCGALEGSLTEFQTVSLLRHYCRFEKSDVSNFRIYCVTSR